MASRGSFKFAIDRGGTFTDVFAECPDNSVRVMKLLSVDPKYEDAPVGELSIMLLLIFPYPFIKMKLYSDGRNSTYPREFQWKRVSQG